MANQGGHLPSARVFFREKVYPWKSPQDDLAAAEKLINDCGYHRRNQALAGAKQAILGQQENRGQHEPVIRRASVLECGG